MKSHYRTTGALCVLTLATAAFGTFGHVDKRNMSIATNNGGTFATERGYAIRVINGDLVLAFETYRRTPY